MPLTHARGRKGCRISRLSCCYLECFLSQNPSLGRCAQELERLNPVFYKKKKEYERIAKEDQEQAAALHAFSYEEFYDDVFNDQ